MAVPALSVDGHAEPRVRLLPRGQQSPPGNQIQPRLERSKHKPGKRPKPSSLLLLCFCSHEKQWQSLSEQLGSQGILLASIGKSRLLRGTGSSACHEIPSGTEGGVSSQQSKRKVELLRKLSSQAGRGITCSIASLWPTWACLWLLFQWLGTSLLAFLITVSHRVSLPCLHIVDSTDPGLCVAF